MSRNDSKYFSTTKKGEIPELKEELNSQYKVSLCIFSYLRFFRFVVSAVNSLFASRRSLEVFSSGLLFC
ncbi:hypothetical protein K1719_032060 [Acacia pycnantha]|nr:hypothetical protein K1719_032060 [Acacia pycnantha]